MRQRVGIARALVMNPDVLLMDEAFSALDVLTGETLRDDMLELWDESRISTKGILIVSHNIEEAVMMADRIIVFASDPGRIRSQVQIGLPRPRNPDSAEVRALIDEVYALMTSRPAHGAPTPRQQGLGYRFPQTEVERMEGVLDVLAEAPFNGRADLPKLAEEAEISDDDLLPACEALGLFGLAQIDRGDIFLTPLGQRYVLADQARSSSSSAASCWRTCRWPRISATAWSRNRPASCRKRTSWIRWRNSSSPTRPSAC